MEGLIINATFNDTLNGLIIKGKALTAHMEALAKGDKLSPEDMVALQFHVGQYNAMMEALSTVTKSMTDLMKSLAQRVN